MKCLLLEPIGSFTCEYIWCFITCWFSQGCFLKNAWRNFDTFSFSVDISWYQLSMLICRSWSELTLPMQQTLPEEQALNGTAFNPLGHLVASKQLSIPRIPHEIWPRVGGAWQTSWHLLDREKHSRLGMNISSKTLPPLKEKPNFFHVLKGITADKKKKRYVVQHIILNHHSKFYQLEHIGQQVTIFIVFFYLSSPCTTFSFSVSNGHVKSKMNTTQYSIHLIAVQEKQNEKIRIDYIRSSLLVDLKI